MSLSPVEIALLTGRWDPQIPTPFSPATELAHAVVQCRFKDALTSDTARAIIVPGTGPTLADAFSITSTETEEDDLARVVLAAACLQAFVQANWTGPDLDIAPLDPGADPLTGARAIVKELGKYDPALAAKPRWLVLNKLDMVPEDERKARVEDFLERFEWDGPVFEISALTGQGCEALCYAIYDYLSEHSDAHRAAEAEDLAADVRFRDAPPAKGDAAPGDDA